MNAAASVDDIDPATGKAIRDKIRSDINPGNNAGLKHNSGKPKEAPYASRNHRDDDPRDKAATYLTNCAEHSRASLACIERNYQNRAACNEFFRVYKECRKEENEQRKAANAKESGDGGSSGWFW